MQRICVVTGGTRGIGFAIGKHLLARGDAVAIAGTSQRRADAAADRLRADMSEASVLPVQCDVREAAAVNELFREVAREYGGVDVLVNNAGVGVGAPVAELSHDEWHRILGINLTGAFHCCKAALPYLQQRGGGWIVNISSLAASHPFAGGAAYCASKAALTAFSDALMQEVRHDNIRVSCVLPGSVATEFSGRHESTGADWRLSPDDVAQVVVDLLAHPARSLPSRVEIRPSRPRK